MKLLRCFLIVPAALSGYVVGYEYRSLLHMAGPMTTAELMNSPWLTAYILSQVLSVILPVVLAVTVAPFHKRAVGFAVSLVSVQQVIWQFVSKTGAGVGHSDLPVFAYEIAAALSVFAVTFAVILVSGERAQRTRKVKEDKVLSRLK